jgi:hypothetical protein
VDVLDRSHRPRQTLQRDRDDEAQVARPIEREQPLERGDVVFRDDNAAAPDVANRVVLERVEHKFVVAFVKLREGVLELGHVRVGVVFAEEFDADVPRREAGSHAA